MQITPGSGASVGGEITPPQQQPPAPQERAPQAEPVVPDAPVAGDGVEVQVAQQPLTENSDPALDRARQEVLTGGDAVVPDSTPTLDTSPGQGDVAQTDQRQGDVAQTDQQLVHNVLTSQDPVGAAAAMEGVVAGNHLKQGQDPNANANIADIAGADAAAQALGPEPVPAPPESAVAITPNTPNNLVGQDLPPNPMPDAQAEQVVPDPQTSQSGESKPPFINTTGYPLPSVDSRPERVLEGHEAETPVDSVAARRILAGISADLERLRAFLNSLEGVEKAKGGQD